MGCNQALVWTEGAGHKLQMLYWRGARSERPGLCQFWHEHNTIHLVWRIIRMVILRTHTCHTSLAASLSTGGEAGDIKHSLSCYYEIWTNIWSRYLFNLMVWIIWKFLAIAIFIESKYKLQILNVMGCVLELIVDEIWLHIPPVIVAADRLSLLGATPTLVKHN